MLVEGGAPASHRGRRWLVRAALLLLGACCVVAAVLRDGAGPAGSAEDRLLVTGSSYDAVKGAPDRIGFTVENLGDRAVRLGVPGIEAPGVTVVGTVGAGRLLEPGRPVTVGISFRLRCAEDAQAQLHAATVVVPYVAADGHRYELRQAPDTPGSQAGAALGEVMGTACAEAAPPAP